MDPNMELTPSSPAFGLRSELKTVLPKLFNRHLIKSKTPKEQRFGLMKDLTAFFCGKGYSCQTLAVNYWEGGAKREGRLDLVVFQGDKPLIALVISREFTMSHLLKLNAAFSLRMLPVAVGLESSQFAAVQALSSKMPVAQKFPWWLSTFTPYAQRPKPPKP